MMQRQRLLLIETPFQILQSVNHDLILQGRSQ